MLSRNVVLFYCFLFFICCAQAEPEILFNNNQPEKDFNIIEKNYVGIKRDIDASAYDSIFVQLENLNPRPLDLNLEIKDSDSKDYWSRVNYYFTASSGHSLVRIPLQLHVGDVSRPGRLINLKKIVSVILAQINVSTSIQDLKIQKIYFDKDISIVPDGVYAFDFGAADTPVFPGFIGVTDQAQYSKKIGYGFENAKFWTPYLHAEDSLQPDSLYRDAVFIPQGVFKVDLPNEVYSVILNLDFSSGYWGEFPLFKKRKVFIQNKEVLNLTLSRDQAADRYFQFAHNDDSVDDDFFTKYYGSIFKEYKLSTVVSNGQLEIRFEGDNCAENPCFGMALTSLIIIPSKLKAKEKTFLTNLIQQRKKEFQQNFSFTFKSTLAVSPAGKTGVKWFKYPLMNDLPETHFPTRFDSKPIELTTLRGQTSSASIAVVNFDSDARFTIKTEKKSSFAIKAWPVSRLITRLQPAGKSFTVAERYLSTDNSFLIKRNRNRRVWLEATAENLPPGTYSSLVTVSSAKSILKIPIHLKVLNWALPAVDFPVGPFNSTIQESWWFAGENNFREEKLLQQSFKMMNSVGLTTASFNAKFEVNWDKKPLIIKGLDRVNHLMNLAKQNHFKSLVAYNAVFSNQDLCYGSFSNADLELWVEALKRQAKLKQWLPLQIIVCDEPVGSEDLKKAVSRVETLQKFSDDHLQFGAAFSFNSQHQESKELYSKSQLPFLNLFDMDKLKSDQKNWIYYNAADRSSFGFGLFRLRQQTALQARIAWNWNQNAGNPYFALDAREDDINWCNSLKDGQLQCSVFLKRHILEGLNDYRLALLLKTLKSEKAQIIVKDIELHASISKDPIPGDFDNKYQQEEAWRNQILSLLESMSDEMSVKAKSK